MKLHEKVALVTGGAVRVGKATALALAARGAHVGITYRSSAVEAADTVAELRALGINAHAVACDQRDPSQIPTAVQEIEAVLGPVDVLVNNAAIFERTPVLDATLDAWDSHLEINLRGPWLFVQAVAPGMRERGAGVILNMVDIAAERPFPSYLPYSVSKAGLVAMTLGLARALGPEIRVNGIAPGAVLWPDDYDPSMQQSFIERTPLRRAGTPDDIARAIVYLIEEAPFVTGAILPVDGGKRLT